MVWGASHEHYNAVYGEEQKHKAKLSHEVLAGGAAFAGFKAFEEHRRKQGKTVSHAKAKELLAGIVGAEVDKLIETKGADAIEHEKIKHHANKQVESMYDDHYGKHDEYDPQKPAHPILHKLFDQKS